MVIHKVAKPESISCRILYFLLIETIHIKNECYTVFRVELVTETKTTFFSKPFHMGQKKLITHSNFWLLSLMWMGTSSFHSHVKWLHSRMSIGCSLMSCCFLLFPGFFILLVMMKKEGQNNIGRKANWSHGNAKDRKELHVWGITCISKSCIYAYILV